MYYGPYVIRGDGGEQEIVDTIIAAANIWADYLWATTVEDSNGNIIPEDILKEIIE